MNMYLSPRNSCDGYAWLHMGCMQCSCMLSLHTLCYDCDAADVDIMVNTHSIAPQAEAGAWSPMHQDNTNA